MLNTAKFKDIMIPLIGERVNLKSFSKDGRILELYIIMIFAFYPLFLLKVEIFDISIKAILFFTFTLMLAVTFIFLALKDQIKLRIKLSKLEIWLLIISFLTISIMFYKILSSSYLNQLNYQTEASILTLIIVYFLISYINNIYAYFFDILQISAIFVYCAVLYQFIGNEGFSKPIELLMSNSLNLTSYLILIITTSILLYCTCNEKRKTIYYFIMSAVGFCLLFINDNIISICIIAILFLIIPVIFIPTAKLIQRNMQLLYLFFLLMGIIGFIINYTDWVKKEISFNMMNGIYINLLLAIVVLCYHRYWKRIPLNIDMNKSIMRRLQKVFIFLLKAVGIFFFLILTVGNKIYNLPPVLGINGIRIFAEKLQLCLSSSNGTFYDVIERYGFVGCILLIIICIHMISALMKNHKKQNQFSVMLSVIAIVFLVQSIFFSQQLVTTPIYVILLTFSVCGKECYEISGKQRVKKIMSKHCAE